MKNAPEMMRMNSMKKGRRVFQGTWEEEEEGLLVEKVIKKNVKENANASLFQSGKILKLRLCVSPSSPGKAFTSREARGLCFSNISPPASAIRLQ